MPGSTDSEFHMLLTASLSKLNMHLFNWLRNAINDLNVMQIWSPDEVFRGLALRGIPLYMCIEVTLTVMGWY